MRMEQPVYVFSFILILLWTIICAEGSGSMYDPPNRAVMWKYGFNMPKNYNYMQLNCGGDTQPENGPIKCGLCGDPYTGPKYHDVGGRYDRGVIGRYYPAGVKEIEVKVELLAFEKGFFEVRMCSADYHPVNRSCFDENILPIKEGYHTNTPLRYYPEKAGDYRLTVALPPNLTCNRCVVQWRYHTGNSWGVDPDTKEEGIGMGLQEEFYNCADIRIGGVIPDSLHNNAFFSPELTHGLAGSVESPSSRGQKSLTTGRVPAVSDHVNLERVATTTMDGRRVTAGSKSSNGQTSVQGTGRTSGKNFGRDNFLAGFEAVKSWQSGMSPSTDSFTHPSGSTVDSSASITDSTIAGFSGDQATHQPILATHDFGKMSTDSRKSLNQFQTLITSDKQGTVTKPRVSNRSPTFVAESGQGSTGFVVDTHRGSSNLVADSSHGFNADISHGAGGVKADSNHASVEFTVDRSKSFKMDTTHSSFAFNAESSHSSADMKDNMRGASTGFNPGMLQDMAGFTSNTFHDSSDFKTDTRANNPAFQAESSHDSSGLKDNLRGASTGFNPGILQDMAGFTSNTFHDSPGLKANAIPSSSGLTVGSGQSSVDVTVDSRHSLETDLSQGSIGPTPKSNQGSIEFTVEQTHDFMVDLSRHSPAFITDSKQGSTQLQPDSGHVSGGFKADISHDATGLMKDVSHGSTGFRQGIGHSSTGFRQGIGHSSIDFSAHSGQSSAGVKADMTRRPVHASTDLAHGSSAVQNTAHLHISAPSMSDTSASATPTAAGTVIPKPSMVDSTPRTLSVKTGMNMVSVGNEMSSVNVPKVTAQHNLADGTFVGLSQLKAGDTTTSSIFDVSKVKSTNAGSSHFIDVSHKPLTDTKHLHSIGVSHSQSTNIASNTPFVDTTTSHFIDIPSEAMMGTTSLSQIDKQRGFGISETVMNTKQATVATAPIDRTTDQSRVEIVHLGSAEKASTIHSSPGTRMDQRGNMVIIDMGGQTNTGALDVSSKLIDKQSGDSHTFQQYEEPMLTDNIQKHSFSVDSSQSFTLPQTAAMDSFTLPHSTVIDSSKMVNVQNQLPSTRVEPNTITKVSVQSAGDTANTFMKSSMVNDAQIQSVGAQTLSIQQPISSSVIAESQFVEGRQPSVKHVRKQQASGFLPRHITHTKSVTDLNMKSSSMMSPAVQTSTSIDLDKTAFGVDQLPLSLGDFVVDQVSGGRMITDVQFESAGSNTQTFPKTQTTGDHVIDTQLKHNNNNIKTGTQRGVPQADTTVEYILETQQANQGNINVGFQSADMASSSSTVDPGPKGGISSVGMKRTDNMISTIIQNKAKDSVELGPTRNGFIQADFGIADVQSVPDLHHVSDTMHGMHDHSVDDTKQILTEPVITNTGGNMMQDIGQHTFKADSQLVGNTQPMSITDVQRTSTVTRTNKVFDPRNRPQNVNIMDSIAQQQTLTNSMNVQQRIGAGVQQGSAVNTQQGAAHGVQQADLNMPQQRVPDMLIDLRKVTNNMMLPQGWPSQSRGTSNIQRRTSGTNLSTGDIQSQLDRFNFQTIPDSPGIVIADQRGSGGISRPGSDHRSRDHTRMGSGSRVFQDGRVTMRQSGLRSEIPDGRFIESRMVDGNFGGRRGPSRGSQINFSTAATRPSPPRISSRSGSLFPSQIPPPQFTSRLMGPVGSDRRPPPTMSQFPAENTITGFSGDSRFSPRGVMHARGPPRMQPGFSGIRPEPPRRRRFMERDQRMTGLGVAIESSPPRRGPFGGVSMSRTGGRESFGGDSMSRTGGRESFGGVSMSRTGGRDSSPPRRGPFGGVSMSRTGGRDSSPPRRGPFGGVSMSSTGGRDSSFRSEGSRSMVPRSFDGPPSRSRRRQDSFRRRDGPRMSGPAFSGGFSRGAPSSFRRFSGGEVSMPPGVSDMFSEGSFSDLANTMADLPFASSFGAFPPGGTGGRGFAGSTGAVTGRGRSIGGPAFGDLSGLGSGTGAVFGGPLRSGGGRGSELFGSPPGPVSLGGSGMIGGPPGLRFPGSGDPFSFSGFAPGGPGPFMF